MAITPNGAAEVPLSVFGGWVTEVDPVAIPENVSPDLGETVLSPGSVGSRPGLSKVFATPFPAGGPNNLVPTNVYGKSFVTPTGDIQNFYLDSNGSLWLEDLTNSPGTYTLLFSTTPGSLCRSITAFNREYFAISNGLLGADIPLQWDGSVLDRVTSDGPGTAPSITMVSFPAVTMQASSAGAAVTVVSIATNNPITVGPPSAPYTIYTGAAINVSSSSSFSTGQRVMVTGNSNSALNQAYTIQSITGNSIQAAPSTTPTSFNTGTGGTIGAPASGITLVRNNNQVTVSTTSPHQLQVGFQALIAGGGSSIVGTSISSIVINNEDNPGIAVVTTSTPHGLVPGVDVTISGVSATAVGGGIATAVRNGESVTLTTASPHGLVPGTQITVAGVTDTTFNGSFVIAIIPGPNQITYAQADTDASSSGGTVSLAWPIPADAPTPTYFEVVEAPTATTFWVQVTYSDATWTTGTVSFPWDGTFYVTQIISATTLTYQQYGPSASSTNVGTVTPFGQMSPGLHLMAVCGITRQGAITEPSPFVSFIANGGQYPSVSNIVTGPPNWVGRIIIFTGAQPDVPGVLPPFFYIPVPAQNEGQVVSTATQINDNSTTSVLLDFADNTLYAALGVNTPGNTLANQIVLDGALGFGKYQSRLLTWGQRNRINNFLNMGFDGGMTPQFPTVPSGWSGVDTSNAGLDYNLAPRYAIFATGGPTTYTLSQSAYLDCYGDPILSGNTFYTVRVWISTLNNVAGATFTVTISSASTAFSESVTFGSLTTNTSAFYERTFASKTPLAIPQDMLLTIVLNVPAVGGGLIVDELSFIFEQTPQIPDVAYASYPNNPEGMDGDEGTYGPVDDTHPIMDQAILRDTLYILTQDPSGRLHATNGSGSSQPAGWDVEEVAANCGSLSAFSLTHSQADDTAASGGDDWMAWASEGGAMIFGGGIPEKISQEIQPNWNKPSSANTAIQINMQAALTIWGVNDPVQRLLIFGLPIGTATAPNAMYVLNYENLNSAQAIAGSPPFHPSLSGKLIATDNCRKWGPWRRPMNGAARMFRRAGELSLVFFGGNGQTPGAAAGFGNVYTLNPNSGTDDDYGTYLPYYFTYPFIDPDRAQALQITGSRIMLAYWAIHAEGSGSFTVTPYPDNLSNPWPLSITRTLMSTARFDLEGGGGNAQGNRIFLKLSSTAGSIWSVSRLVAWFRKAKLGIRGAQ